MSDIFQIANVGLLDGKQRLEAISLNAASASLPGYRRHVSAAAFDAALAAPAPANNDGSQHPAATAESGSRSLLQHVDLQRGGMIATGRALDLAIDANELFFALTDGTRTWLTRAGTFRMNEDGVLVGENGLRVIGTQGDIQLPSSEVTVAGDGRITHQGVIVGAVQLFRPNDPVSLQAAPGTLLIAPSGMQPAEPGSARIRSGTLEASNTDAGREMLGLMAISRQFESLSRIVQSYDELLGRAIQTLGEV
jgi:flagellar basal-body rod protein FlgF